MKRKVLSIVALMAISATSGCLAVSATDNSRGVRNHCGVVAVGNDVYIVDMRSGEVRRIDISNAKPFSAPDHEVSHATETE